MNQKMILQAKGISKSFRLPKPIQLLSDVSLTLFKGESVAIMGRSGEGKTTLLHILGTLESPDEGLISIAGISANPKNAPFLRNQHIGFIFQSFNLLEDFSVLENVLMPARIGRKKVDLEYGLFLLEEVGLESRAHFPAKLLSGGERQRVAIARALCNDPDLILADEPSGNLDRENSEQIRSLLLSLVQEKKKGLVLVTHDLEWSHYCDQKFTLQEKKIYRS